MAAKAYHAGCPSSSCTQNAVLKGCAGEIVAAGMTMAAENCIVDACAHIVFACTVPGECPSPIQECRAAIAPPCRRDFFHSDHLSFRTRRTCHLPFASISTSILFFDSGRAVPSALCAPVAAAQILKSKFSAPRAWDRPESLRRQSNHRRGSLCLNPARKRVRRSCYPEQPVVCITSVVAVQHDAHIVVD